MNGFTSRRSFLSGEMLNREKSFWHNSQRIPPATEDTACYVQIKRPAMACDFLIFLNAGEYSQGVDVALDALDEVTRLEYLLSYFREESEITRINKLAPLPEGCSADSEVFSLLLRCDELCRITHGAFNMTATPLWEAWGFSAHKGRVPDHDELQNALACVDAEAVLLDSLNEFVRFTRPSIKISLGGIGKGYALDRAAEKMREQDVVNFLFHGGSSSVIASGTRRGRNDWLVGLHHPRRAGVRIASFPLKNRALGTSGSATQHFWHNGKQYGHILDPRTGFPAHGVLSATVLAPDAATADALATAMYVLGVDYGQELCEQNPELGIIYVLDKPGGELEFLQFGNVS